MLNLSLGLPQVPRNCQEQFLCQVERQRVVIVPQGNKVGPFQNNFLFQPMTQNSVAELQLIIKLLIANALDFRKENM